jgi:DNA polymerase-3 subunit epsilon
MRNQNHENKSGMPIPPKVSAIHGITDEDVKDAPKFSEVAGCDKGF